MRCERICSLCRYLIAESLNAPLTASAQWLERSLDDSANRRLSMPEAFLCADAVLRLAYNVCAGLRVNEKIIARTVRDHLPFMATENLLMEGVKRGGDRQQLHEVIRRCSMESVAVMREGLPCDLLSRLARQPEFGLSEAELNAVLDPKAFIGRAPEQVERFLSQYEHLWADAAAESAEITV
jgi:adenylosuccinate lyase